MLHRLALIVLLPLLLSISFWEHVAIKHVWSQPTCYRLPHHDAATTVIDNPTPQRVRVVKSEDDETDELPPGGWFGESSWFIATIAGAAPIVVSILRSSAIVH